jgi:6-phosphogluconolactonase/glucosamine-6-phosphate isomerase/deaminase
MLVSGEGKRQVVLDILADPQKTETAYPAAQVRPAGNLYWFLDDEFV